MAACLLLSVDVGRCLQRLVHFYPLETDLSPAVDFLEARVEQGDVVICVDYFGACQALNFERL